jgi:hypothetical protein
MPLTNPHFFCLRLVASLGVELLARESHLTADGDLERCAVCGYSLPADVKPSISMVFADHLRKAQHRPG